MKRTLFYVGVVLLTILILLVGSICFADSEQPTATMYGWIEGTGWVRLEADVTHFLIVHTSTDSDVNIYNDGNRARVIQGNSDGELAADYGLLTRGMLYGFNGTTWDRIRLNELDHVWVETDTNSVVGVYKDGNIAEVMQGNSSGVSAALYGLLGQNMLYAFNGTTFDRLLVDTMDSLIVVTSSLSVTQSRNYYWDAGEGIWKMGLCNPADHQIVQTDTDSITSVYYNGYKAIVEPDQDLRVETSTDSTVSIYYNGVKVIVQADGQMWVETSTDSTASIYYNGNKAIVEDDQDLRVETSTDSMVQIHTEGNKAVVEQGNADGVAGTLYGLITQSNLYAFNGTDSWDRLRNDINDWLRVNISSSVQLDNIINETIKQYLLISTGTDGIIARLENLANGVTTYMTESQFDELNSSIDDIFNQMKTSVTTSYKVDNSTYVYRNFYDNGTLTVNFHVKSIGVYAQGGNATVSWDGGDTINVWEGIPFGDVPIDETFDSPVTFTHTLSAPTTFSIYIRGRL